MGAQRDAEAQQGCAGGHWPDQRRLGKGETGRLDDDVVGHRLAGDDPPYTPNAENTVNVKVLVLASPFGVDITCQASGAALDV